MAGPSMQPVRAASLMGADFLQPKEQGSYDGLCGLYAIINALTLALTPICPLSRQQQYALFLAGLRSLDRAHMVHAGVRDGLPIELWHAILDDLCDAAGTMLSLSVQAAPAFKPRVIRAEMFAQVEAAICNGMPVVMPIEGALNHYTVINGYTATSLRLFDSAGLRWFKRATCGVDMNDRHFRHRLDVVNARIISVEAHEESG